MNTRQYGLLVCTFLSLAVPVLAGCEDEFLTSASVNRMRLLGMRYTRRSAEPDPAWLAPGASGRFDFSVAFGQPDQGDSRDNPLADVRSMMIHCTKAEILDGQPQCAEVLCLANPAACYGQPSPDAGVPDAGAPDGGVTQEQIDAALAALREGIACGDPNDTTRPFWYAQEGIKNAQVTTFPASLQCPHDENDNALRLVSGTVPADYRPNDAGRRLGLAPVPDRLIQGVICEYGEPIFKSEAPFFGCRYEIDENDNLPDRQPIAEVFFYTVHVEHEGLSNNHPKFERVPDERVGAAPDATRVPIGLAADNGGSATPSFVDWDLPVTAVSIPRNCAGVAPDMTDPTDPRPPVVPIRDFGDKSKIRIPVEAMRELASTNPDRREVYQVEAFSNFGELDRRFSVIDDLDVEPVAELDWDHGKRPSVDGALVGGQRVDFQFLIRDGRGGFVIENRTLCLCAGTCPPAP